MAVHEELAAAVRDTTAAAAAADQARLDAIRAAVAARVPREDIARAAGYAGRDGLAKLLRRHAG